MRVLPGVVMAAAVAFGSPAWAETKPNSLQSMMLFRSAVQDHQDCRVRMKGDTPVFAGAAAGSAASTCPDAYAWTQFAEAIKGEFWKWSLDQTIWVGEPWGLCTAEDDGATCCDPTAPVNVLEPNTHCPYFPADYDPIPLLPTVPNGLPSNTVLNDHGSLVLADQVDPGRLLRDLELELVFRNRSMFDHIYYNDLYSREGLASYNIAQNAALSAGDIGKAQRLQVNYPIDATMVKVDFVHQDILLSLGLIQDLGDGNPPNHPRHPFLTVRLDNDQGKGAVPGVYYMMAMTNASKAIPIWHWYAMEHVLNPGRCDYIGCNDSFGFTVNGAMQEGADFGDSYIPPMMELNNDKVAKNDPLFVTGGVYRPRDTGERMTSQLRRMFNTMGIGTDEADSDWTTITVGDPAWRNYRLKGTQTTFNTSAGVPTGMGATLTEGGFVNSASCTTCHSQSSVNAQGFSGIQGVGATWRPNLLGYGQVAMGAPDGNWFYNFGGPSINATQMDFVWGILGASCVNAGATHNDPCTSYHDEPVIIKPLD